MGHNSVISGHPEFTVIPRVDGLSTGPPDLGHHIFILGICMCEEVGEDSGHGIG